MNNPSVRGDSLPGRSGHRDQHTARLSPTVLPVVLVGAGRRGVSAHIPALQRHTSLELAAIVDTADRVNELSLAAKLAVPMYENLDACLSAMRPSLAIVATPHDSHVTLTSNLLQARVPTILEKPPARNLSEFNELVNFTNNYGTPLATALPFHFQNRYRGFIRSLKSPVLTDAQVLVRADVPSRPGVGNWRLSRERAGGGVLIDLGYHYLELIMACLGWPNLSSAHLTTSNSPRNDVEHEARVSLRFEARRISVSISLRSGFDLERRNELSILKNGQSIYTSSAQTTSQMRDNTPSGCAPAPASAAFSQLSSLVHEGFLTGRGGWQRALGVQMKVMRLLDELYSNAHLSADISEGILA